MGTWCSKKSDVVPIENETTQELRKVPACAPEAGENGVRASVSGHPVAPEAGTATGGPAQLGAGAAVEAGTATETQQSDKQAEQDAVVERWLAGLPGAPDPELDPLDLALRALALCQDADVDIPSAVPAAAPSSH
eukprot:RCo031802